MGQLDEWTLTENHAASNLQDIQLVNKVYFDQHEQFRPESQQLYIRDLVLLHMSNE